ncbi:MAG: sigma-70 family RNA polymerase sigma factor [Planctomycetes bacterium]|nr:sigma-70 family RNA polymerase sigma factor [Planctomycetota bacterium]
MNDVTRILNAIERGDRDPTGEAAPLGPDPQATEALLPLVYEELRLLAAQRLSHEAPGQTLQATALVHEAYLRLVGDEPRGWHSRGHFFAAAAEATRRILVENARRKKSLKRGGGGAGLDLDAMEAAAPDSSDDLVALDEALARLGQVDPEKAALVKLRFFAGLSIDQAAEALGISRATAIRHWSFARAWLYHEMHRDG